VKGRGLRFFFRPLALIVFLCLPVLLRANALEDSRRALLINILRERKIPFETRSLFADFGGFGSSIHVMLPAAAEEKKPGVFILALPFSFAGDDQRDFPYAFQVALDFIGRVRAEGLETGAMVAFLGDERPSLRAGTPHLGLMDLYSRLELPEDAVMIYLDICGEAGEIVIHHGALRTLAPLNILRPLAQICDEQGIPYTLAVNANELYKLGLADGPSALEIALGRETPALYLAGGAPGRMANLDKALFDYARSIGPGTGNPDYHYLIFQVLKRFFFVSERATTLFFLAVAGLFFFAALIYSMVFRHRLIVQWKVFFKRSWILFIYWLALCLALKAGALIFRRIAGGADPALFGGSSLLFYAAAAFQLLLGISLFTVLSFPGDLIYVPRRSNFYGSSAIILAIAELLISAYIDITFIPMFIWAFLFTFLAACLKKPVLIWICGLLSFYLAFSAMATVLQAGNEQLGLLIFSGNTAFILYIALISLPFLVTLKRGALLRSREAGAEKLLPDILKQLTGPAAVFKFIAPRLIAPAAAAAALALSVHFLVRSPAALLRQQIQEEDSENAAVLSMDVRDRTLLERRTLNITLSAPGNPLRFGLRLESAARGEMPVIYSAAMPYRYREEDNSPSRSAIEFILGEGPPNPFSTEIVLPADFAGFLQAEALYFREEDGRQLSIRRRYAIGFEQQFR
jgi:hypothetical protein